MELPPRITLVSDNGLSLGGLASAREHVRDGGIALLRGCRFEGSLDVVLSALGAVLKPVYLPPGKQRDATTSIAESGPVLSATSWHHDQSFARKPPDWSALFCLKAGSNPVPTFFCDGAALAALLSPGFNCTLRELRAWHQAEFTSEQEPETSTNVAARHPVMQKAEGGYSAVFVSPANVERFDGWTVPESAPLLDYLYGMLNWPEVTVGHFWRPGDLLLWPNRRYLHRALPLDAGAEERQLLRVVGHWAVH